MNEEVKNEEQEDIVHTIPLKRHLWPEEVELNKTKKKLKRARILGVILCVFALGIGWFGGSILPFGWSYSIRSSLLSLAGVSKNDKISAVEEIMDTSWYFGKDIEDLDDRLIDQAIIGMTSNTEDKHTEYMSEKETEAFKQSINRNYVGIGAQFIMYNGFPIITKVFPHSPAENAGLQAGDILEKVNEESVEGLSSSDVKDKIQGDEGTQVSLTVKRNDEDVTLTAVRGTFSATTFAKMLDDSTLYLQLAQFGESTAEDIKEDLDGLLEGKDKVSMILDLRGNGGGYLTSVKAVASYFLDNDQTVLIQEFKDGSEVKITTTPNQKYSQIHTIVILVNENTASAAEVMTLALKQNRDDVTVIGTTTYGKGTVQTTTGFKDGSSLKYTTSRWLSPEKDWINETGITPDEEVQLHEAISMTYPEMKEGDSYDVDEVSDVIKAVQVILDYFGYAVDRQDGYFSVATQQAWMQFKEDHGLSGGSKITRNDYMNAVSEVMYDWATSTDHDTQLARALEVVHG